MHNNLRPPERKKTALGEQYARQHPSLPRRREDVGQDIFHNAHYGLFSMVIARHALDVRMERDCSNLS